MNRLLLDNYAVFKRLGSDSDGDSVDYKKFYHATQELIAELIFSDAESLYSLLQRELNEDFFNLPFWLRALIFRLILFQKPSIDLYERAISDLRSFLPDEDEVLIKMEKELDEFREKAK